MNYYTKHSRPSAGRGVCDQRRATALSRPLPSPMDAAAAVQEATAAFTAVAAGTTALSQPLLASWCAACRAATAALAAPGAAAAPPAHGLARLCASLLSHADLCVHLAQHTDGGAPMLMVVLHALSAAAAAPALPRP